MKTGSQWRSAACECEVIVVRAPADEVTLHCGGHPMVAKGAEPAASAQPRPGFDSGTLLGKRNAPNEVEPATPAAVR